MGTEEEIIKKKLGLLKLAQQLGNVSKACQIMGYSREHYYHFKKLYEIGGQEALKGKSHKRQNQKNRVKPYIEEAVKSIAIENPTFGDRRASNELKKKGMRVSNSGVRNIWQRYDLGTMKKRLEALEARIAQDGLVLNDFQLMLLEQSRKEREAPEPDDIQTEYPGYLGVQDTFFVGAFNGVGHIYQQTFIDTYCNIAFVKIYPMIYDSTSVDLLYDRVLPFYESHGVRLHRILTDHCQEYCGKMEEHAFQLYLTLLDIDHIKTRAESSQTNVTCESFHKTIMDEFYSISFRRKVYTTIDEIQLDLDEWIRVYNYERMYSGKYCYGKTPMQTFFDSKHIADEKNRFDQVVEQ